MNIGTEWKNFDLATMERHHLEGLLFSGQLVAKEDERYSHLFKVWSSQWHYNEIQLQCLRKIDRALAQIMIECVLLKGTGLLLRYYQDLGARKVSDLDLLVSQKDKQKTEFLFRQMGYQRIPQTSWWGDAHKSVWEKNIDGTMVIIELHWQIFFGTRFEWQTDELQQLSNFMQIKHFSPELEFCYLVAHYATQHNFQKLFWLGDIKLLLEKHDLNWQQVFAIAKKLRIQRAIRMVLQVVKMEFGANHSTAVPQFPNEWWGKYLGRNLYVEGKRDYRYWLIKHLTKDSLLKALVYDFFWFFHRINKKLRGVKR